MQLEKMKTVLVHLQMNTNVVQYSVNKNYQADQWTEIT